MTPLDKDAENKGIEQDVFKGESRGSAEGSERKCQCWLEDCRRFVAKRHEVGTRWRNLGKKTKYVVSRGGRNASEFGTVHMNVLVFRRNG